MENTPSPVSRPLPGQSPPQHVQVSQCVVSFGSNLGDRQELIAEAAARLASDPVVLDGDLRTSRLFQTPPIGGPGGQEPFLNAVGMFVTHASAREVLSVLQRIEQQLGRRRRLRWDARSIDLDVVLHGSLVGGASNLVVPHPRYPARQFVLLPACDVAAELRDPRFGWTLSEMSEHLAADTPSLALVGADQAFRSMLCHRLSEEHGVAIRSAQRGWQRLTANEFGSADEVGQSHAGELSQPIVDGEAALLSEQEVPWVCDGVPWGQPHSAVPAESAKVAQASQSNVSARQSSVLTLDALWGGVRPAISRLTGLPRLVVRLERPASKALWPAPHRMWAGGWSWPEYHLEGAESDWAVSELASVLQAMHCPVKPVTEDGRWW